MNEEEKKIFLHLKKVSEERTIILLDDEIGIMLNLIEKLQKEKEELKIKYDNDTHKLQNDLDIANAEIVELRKENELAKQVLINNCDIADERNQLLKENEELKIKEFQLHLATEEMKSMIYKQKVKDKIEELEKEYEYLAEENQRVNKFEIELLQELIEEREEK